MTGWFDSQLIDAENDCKVFRSLIDEVFEKVSLEMRLKTKRGVENESVVVDGQPFSLPSWRPGKS